MLMTFISLLGGGFMRLLPELIGLWNKKTDNAHELNMLSKQFELEQTRSAAKQAEIAQQGDIDQMLALMASQKGALISQMQLTGNKFVDALNMLVRPLTTYYFLALYGMAKIAMFAIAVQDKDVWKAILQVYTPDDLAMFSGILAFWFVGRVFDKKQAQ